MIAIEGTCVLLLIILVIKILFFDPPEEIEPQQLAQPQFVQSNYGQPQFEQNYGQQQFEQNYGQQQF